MVLSPEGFVPDQLALFEGERLRLFLATTESREGCLIIPEFGVFLGVLPGSISSAEIVFERAGRFRYHCPGKGRSGLSAEGFITVLKRGEKKGRGGRSRNPASISGEGFTWRGMEVGDDWMPREF